MRTISTLFLLTLSIFTCSLFAQTLVSGTIQANTTWTKANSPYLLTGTVGIPAAYVLTIEAGVTVKRTGDYQILVNGAVKCIGTQTDSITFLSDGSINNSNLYFLEFQKSHLTASALRYITFQNASGNANNIRIGNESDLSQTNPKNSGTLVISRSNLSYGYSATKGYQAAQSLDIDSCHIISANITGYYPRSEKINISNSFIQNSSILSDSYNYGITFTNCSIEKCLLTAKCCGANLSFIHCKVSDSNLGDVYGEATQGPLTISNSIFLNTPVNNAFAKLVLKNSLFTATKPLFTYQNPDTEITYLLTAGNLTMTNCQLIDLSGRKYSGLYLTGLLGSFVGGGNIITNNLFTNLYDAFYTDDFATITLNYNNFFSVSRYQIANYSVLNFSALYDYFDLKPGQSFYDVIFDNKHDLTYGIVTYTPYAITPVAASPISKPTNVTKMPKNGDVFVNWHKNKESNTKGYKVYWGYIDGFTYLHSATTLNTDTSFTITGGNIDDSIAVTAFNTKATGTDDQQAGYESWFSPAAVTQGTLAATLVSFSASVFNNSASYITWQTANELNTAHFDIERGNNAVDFLKIGSVNAAAGGSFSNSYSFTDHFPLQGNNYYRLKVVDNDNNAKYSNIIKISISNLTNMAVKIYPNPAQNFITISCPAGIKDVVIVNSLGQKIMHITPSAASRQVNANVGNVPAGIYKVVITTNASQQQTATFVR